MDKIDNWDILTQFTSKKGQDIVICNLSEHVSQVGRQEYISCPLCSRPEQTVGYSENRRRKLHTDGYVGYCYRCGRAFLNPRESEGEYIEIDDVMLSTQIKSYEFNESPTEVFDSFNPLNDYGLKYLQGRNPIFSREFCKAMGIKSLMNGVAIPFYLDGKFVFYVIRFINVHGNRRYHMPSGIKPLYIPTLVSKSKFIIVEGCFDAFAVMLLYPEYTPCAILGSKITVNQLKYLSDRFNPDEILVYLDDSGKSTKTMNFIKSMWKGSYDINIVPSDGQDPEECLKSILK